MARTSFSLSAALLILLGCIVPSHSATADEAKIEGSWSTAKSDAIIELFTQNDQLNGRVLWLKARQGLPGEKLKDVHNPDPKKHKDPLLGMLILRGFKAADSSRKEWTGGTIYDPSTGKTYQARLRLRADDTLELRGYIGIPTLGKTEIWKRAKSAPSP